MSKEIDESLLMLKRIINCVQEDRPLTVIQRYHAEANRAEIDFALIQPDTLASFLEGFAVDLTTDEMKEMLIERQQGDANEQ